MPAYVVLTQSKNSYKFARTIENQDADLYPNRWIGKSMKRYLVVERQKNAPEILTDLVLVSDDDSTPPGFSAIDLTFDSREKKWIA